MLKPARHLLRLSLIAVCLLSGAAAPPSRTSIPTSLAAGWSPEVRIRKLHLVRPDLILYPIAYEVVC